MKKHAPHNDPRQTPKPSSSPSSVTQISYADSAAGAEGGWGCNKHICRRRLSIVMFSMTALPIYFMRWCWKIKGQENNKPIIHTSHKIPTMDPKIVAKASFMCTFFYTFSKYFTFESETGRTLRTFSQTIAASLRHFVYFC